MQNIPADQHNDGFDRKKEKSSGNILIFVVLALFAIVFGATGIGMLFSSYWKAERCSATTEGVVTAYESKMLSNRKKGYCPILEYEAGGEMLTVPSNFFASPKPFRIGKQVTVAYNPTNPREFYIKDFELKDRCKMGVGFAVLGFLFLIFIIVAISTKRLDAEKRKLFWGKAVPVVGAFVIFLVWALFIGFKLALLGAICFGLYAKYEKKRKRKE